MPACYLYVFLGEMSVQILPILIKFFFFLLSNFNSSLHILDTSLFVRSAFCKGFVFKDIVSHDKTAFQMASGRFALLMKEPTRHGHRGRKNSHFSP